MCIFFYAGISILFDFQLHLNLCQNIPRLIPVLFSPPSFLLFLFPAFSTEMQLAYRLMEITRILKRDLFGQLLVRSFSLCVFFCFVCVSFFFFTLSFSLSLSLSRFVFRDTVHGVRMFSRWRSDVHERNFKNGFAFDPLFLRAPSSRNWFVRGNCFQRKGKTLDTRYLYVFSFFFPRRENLFRRSD